MWAAIRSDLKEFVTVVTDESNTVLASQRADGDVQDNEQDQQEDEEQGEEEVKQRGIIMGEDGEVIYDDDDSGVMEEEIDSLVREEETFTEPLDTEDEEVKEFLSEFKVETKTDDISRLLEENPETLQVQFESLVPTQISYKEFWERYYFRCDEDRIRRRWEVAREEARKARAEAIAGGIRGVKNLFGGAVKAVSSTFDVSHDDGGDQPVAASPFQSMAPPHQSGGGMHLFGASGRPPFVMNTAVDEDEDEEEELGWDDDDDDLVDDDEEDDTYEEDESEVIEFSGGNDEELEKIVQQLSQAIEERDQLHKTVEMQANEIAKLQSGEASGTASKGPDESALAKLKMELFEKDSELAALKASLEDTHEDGKEDTAKKDNAKLAAQEREMEQLRGIIAEKDAEMTQVKDQLVKSAAEIDQLRASAESDKNALMDAETAKQELETLVKTLQEQLAASQLDAESLRTAAEAAQGDTAPEVARAKDEAAVSMAQVESLTMELEEMKGNLHFTTGRADHLETELQQTKEALQAQKAEFEQKLADEIAKVQIEHEQLSASSPNSQSTGVQIQPPLETSALPTVMRLQSSGDDEEDDWGEEWGDEDD